MSDIEIIGGKKYQKDIKGNYNLVQEETLEDPDMEDQSESGVQDGKKFSLREIQAPKHQKEEKKKAELHAQEVSGKQQYTTSTKCQVDPKANVNSHQP